ncbi:MAG: hypothetical protein HC848_10435 [Limnobacter sp.]|nr:hypothetical protein [Limnobacter sp.]
MKKCTKQLEALNQAASSKALHVELKGAINAEIISTLSKCTNLQSIGLDLRADEENLETFIALKAIMTTIVGDVLGERVKSLRLHTGDNPQKIEDVIRTFPFLQALELNGIEKAGLWQPLPNLECLILINCKSLQEVSNYDNLTELTLRDCQKLKKVANLQELAHRQKLDIQRCPGIEKQLPLWALGGTYQSAALAAQADSLRSIMEVQPPKSPSPSEEIHEDRTSQTKRARLA